MPELLLFVGRRGGEFKLVGGDNGIFGFGFGCVVVPSSLGFVGIEAEDESRDGEARNP